MSRFFHVGLIVTGKGEAEFLPHLLRALTTGRRCTFSVIARVGQLSPFSSPRKKLKVTGTSRDILPRDATTIGGPARHHLQEKGDDALVILIDDLEHDRRGARQAIFQRYREALDTMLGPHYTRASVHFLVNMLEAYYFADTRPLRDLHDLHIADLDGDVESIRHPKNDLKALLRGFREVDDGRAIVARLDVGHILGRHDACASLRVLFAWCLKKFGVPPGARFALTAGIYDIVTGRQLDDHMRSSASR